jgi:DNA-binding MarR family transcriptional regulator
VNFNIPINNLKFTLNLLDNISKINDVFPRNYLIDSENKKIEWNLKNFTDYSLFLVKFDEINNLTENNENNKSMFGILITILILSLIIIIIKLLIKYKKLELNFIKNKNIPKENEKLEENVLNLNLSLKEEDKNNIEDNKIDFEKYLNEYAEKYLTENEKEVLFVIKNNEGILQNEILNYLPKLNKSTLSKIISKLETKKVLNKIKVGKVNKIFLGEKFKNLK